MPTRASALVLLLVLAACDTAPTYFQVGDLSHDPAALVGMWDLAAFTSSGQIGPSVRAPVAAGTETFGIDGDGTYTRDRAGQDPEAGTYTVDGTSLRLGGRREYFGIDGDRLYFDDRPTDGSLQEFRRR